MIKIDLVHARPLADFMVGTKIRVSDRMQKNYEYKLVEPVGENFDERFTPALAPSEMLRLGVFEGKYLNDCTHEFPREWFENALVKLSPDTPDISKNFFQTKSRLGLSEWQRRGWIVPPDPRGWFQWYCRYFLGRRISDVDDFQIKRWRAFARHAAQIRKNCLAGDLACRPRQRQALLQWAWDPLI